MEIIKRKVEREIYRIDSLCKQCKKGFMIYNNKGRKVPNLIPNQRPKILYQHVCSECKAEKSFEVKYPFHEEVFKVVK